MYENDGRKRLTSHLLIGLFLAIPFGMLADKYGRKWLMVLNISVGWIQAAWLYLVCEYDSLTERP